MIFLTDAEIFSRGVKCPNISSTTPPKTQRNGSEPSMGDAMNITGNPFSAPRKSDDYDYEAGPVYGNGRGFCDYSMALPHYDV